MKNRNNETLFEKRAQNLLKSLDPDGLRRGKFPRPFIIEVTGSPDSGKTTTLTLLDTFFRRQGYRVWKPLEGAEAIREIPRTSHRYNIATGIYALAHLLNNLNNGELDLILFDRCIYDAWCWQLYWQNKEDVTKEEMTFMQAFFAHKDWRHNIDIAFFIMCDPKVAMERDQQWSLTQKSGSYTNLKTVTELFGIFKTGYSYFKRQGAPVVLIDTTNITPKQAVKKVLTHALDAFERRFKKLKEKRL